MSDPDQAPVEREWGNLRFRGRAATRAGADGDLDANSRFVTGLIVFLVVALLYPWYAYWVNSHLLSRDLEVGLRAFEREAGAATAQANQQAAMQAEASEADRQRRALAAVRVLGASASGSRPLVIVRYEGVSLDDAGPTICAQARGWLDRPLSGVTLRVQQHRGRAPAVDVGVVDC